LTFCFFIDTFGIKLAGHSQGMKALNKPIFRRVLQQTA